MGAIIFLPFPGWQKLVGFISSAAILSFALAPLSLVALRKQLPQRPRPYRLPMATPLAAMGFIISNCIFYWTGWETNGTLFLGILIGFLIVLGMIFFDTRGGASDWDLRSSLWLLPYLGSFGNGKALLPAGWDVAVIAIVSLPIYWLALHYRKPAARVVDTDVDG